MQPIEFWAVVNKVQTLAACKIHGQVLDVSLTEHGLDVHPIDAIYDG